MNRIYESADAAMLGTLREVIEGGARSEPRGKPTYDVTSYAMVIRDPRKRICHSRDGFRYGYPAALLAWNLARRNDVAGLLPWNPNAPLFSDDGETVQGENYGERMWPSLMGALHVLKRDPYSRRPWISVWKPGREYGEVVYDESPTPEALDEMPVVASVNVPCCIGFGLRIVGGRLVMQTVMRSQSLWGVFPYDVFLFTALQELIANELGCALGWYEHVMLSAHVYDHELRFVKPALERPIVSIGDKRMDPIGRTLGEAQGHWPELLAAIEEKGPRHPGRSVDPIEQLMLDYAPRLAEK